MRARFHLPLLLALLVVPLIPGGEAAAAQSRYELPLRGVIRSPKAGLNLRDAPPSATAFSYRLAEKICTPQNGTEFVATERVFIANGEIWYRVRLDPDRLVQDERFVCPTDEPLTGWLVARTKTGSKVDVLEEGVAWPEVGLTRGPDSAAPEEDEETTEALSFGLLLEYVLLLLGTAAAVSVVSIESAGSIAPSRWLTRLVVFEFGVLAVVNLLAAGLLIDQLVVVDDPGVMFRLFSILQETTGGFALLGFLLSVVLLRFVSFARET